MSVFAKALIVVNLLYLPALFGGFLLDDYWVILGYKGVMQQSFWEVLTTPQSGFFRPIGYTVIWIFSRLFDLNVFGYHLANLLMFNVILILFHRIAMLLTRDEFLAGMAALLYGIHPINSMFVNYITASGLATYIILLQLSLWSLLSYLEDQKQQKLYTASILFFALALFSHEISLIYLFLAGWVLIYREGSWKERIMRIVPYAGVAVLFLLFRSVASPVSIETSGIAQFLIKSPLTYMASLSDLISWYLSKLIWPHNIVFLWSVKCSQLLALPTAIAACFFILAAVVLCIRWRKTLQGFALVFFLIGLLPAVLACYKYYPQDPFIEPHWFYFTSWGFFLLAAMALQWCKNKFPSRFLLIAGILFVLNGALLLNNHWHWRSQEAYCRYWLSLNRFNLTPYFGLGESMIQQGRYKEAIAVFKDGIDITKGYHLRIMGQLGYAEFKLGRIPQAQHYFNYVHDTSPRYPPVYAYWGEMSEAQGDLKKAEEYYVKALILAPRDRDYLRRVIDIRQRLQNDKPLL